VPLRLGKQPATVDERDLRLRDYLTTNLPKLPATIGHASSMPAPRLMLGNGPDDTVAPGFEGAGDCVFAMICNAVRLATAIGGTYARFTGREAIAAYSTVTGYRLNDESTDRGTNMRTALNWWRKTGILDADGRVHKLGAYMALDIRNLHDELEALYLFDVGVALGIVFPATAMSEFDEGKPWRQTGGEIDGGHAILWDAHSSSYDKVETWARDQEATHAFLAAQVDEAYALLMPETLTGGKTLEGFNLQQLQADLAAL
jgi:hypothetical protein